MENLPKKTRIFNGKKYKLFFSFNNKSVAQERARNFKAGKLFKHTRIIEGKCKGKPTHHLYVRS